MIDSKKIEKISRKIHESVPKEIQRFSANVEKKIQRTLQSCLIHLNLVSREEFDEQIKILSRAHEKLALLEQRLKEIEDRNSFAKSETETESTIVSKNNYENR